MQSNPVFLIVRSERTHSCMLQSQVCVLTELEVTFGLHASCFVWIYHSTSIHRPPTEGIQTVNTR